MNRIAHRAVVTAFGALVAAAAVVAFSMPAVADADQPLTHHGADLDAHSLSPLAFEFIGFDIPDDAFPLEIALVGPSPAGLSDGEVIEAMEDAANQWNDVACSSARIEVLDTSRSFNELKDHQIPVYFDEFQSPQLDRLAATSLPSGAAPQGIEVRINTTRYRWALEAHPFERLDDDVERSTLSLPAVLTHEFGHVLGLHHTDTHRAATMAANYLDDGSQRHLSADDKLGICQLYPDPGDECTTDSDCGSADCISGDYGRVCDIYLADIGDYCALDLQHCPERCYLDNADVGIGYCTTSCRDRAECPDHFQCGNLTDEDETQYCQFSPDTGPSQQGCSTRPAPAFPTFAAIFMVIAALVRRRITA